MMRYVICRAAVSGALFALSHIVGTDARRPLVATPPSCLRRSPPTSRCAMHRLLIIVAAVLAGSAPCGAWFLTDINERCDAVEFTHPNASGHRRPTWSSHNGGGGYRCIRYTGIRPRTNPFAGFPAHVYLTPAYEAEFHRDLNLMAALGANCVLPAVWDQENPTESHTAFVRACAERGLLVFPPFALGISSAVPMDDLSAASGHRLDAASDADVQRLFQQFVFKHRRFGPVAGYVIGYDADRAALPVDSFAPAVSRLVQTARALDPGKTLLVGISHVFLLAAVERFAGLGVDGYVVSAEGDVTDLLVLLGRYATARGSQTPLPVLPIVYPPATISPTEATRHVSNALHTSREAPCVGVGFHFADQPYAAAVPDALPPAGSTGVDCPEYDVATPSPCVARGVGGAFVSLEARGLAEIDVPLSWEVWMGLQGRRLSNVTWKPIAYVVAAAWRSSGASGPLPHIVADAAAYAPRDLPVLVVAVVLAIGVAVGVAVSCATTRAVPSEPCASPSDTSGHDDLVRRIVATAAQTLPDAAKCAPQLDTLLRQVRRRLLAVPTPECGTGLDVPADVALVVAAAHGMWTFATDDDGDPWFEVQRPPQPDDDKGMGSANPPAVGLARMSDLCRGLGRLGYDPTAVSSDAALAERQLQNLLIFEVVLPQLTARLAPPPDTCLQPPCLFALLLFGRNVGAFAEAARHAAEVVAVSAADVASRSGASRVDSVSTSASLDSYLRPQFVVGLHREIQARNTTRAQRVYDDAATAAVHAALGGIIPVSAGADTAARVMRAGVVEYTRLAMLVGGGHAAAAALPRDADPAAAAWQHVRAADVRDAVAAMHARRFSTCAQDRSLPCEDATKPGDATRGTVRLRQLMTGYPSAHCDDTTLEPRARAVLQLQNLLLANSVVPRTVGIFASSESFPTVLLAVLLYGRNIGALPQAMQHVANVVDALRGVFAPDTNAASAPVYSFEDLAAVDVTVGVAPRTVHANVEKIRRRMPRVWFARGGFAILAGSFTFVVRLCALVWLGALYVNEGGVELVCTRDAYVDLAATLSVLALVESLSVVYLLWGTPRRGRILLHAVLATVHGTVLFVLAVTSAQPQQQRSTAIAAARLHLGAIAAVAVVKDVQHGWTSTLCIPGGSLLPALQHASTRAVRVALLVLRYAAAAGCIAIYSALAGTRPFSWRRCDGAFAFWIPYVVATLAYVAFAVGTGHVVQKVSSDAVWALARAFYGSAAALPLLGFFLLYAFTVEFLVPGVHNVREQTLCYHVLPGIPAVACKLAVAGLWGFQVTLLVLAITAIFPAQLAAAHAIARDVRTFLVADGGARKARTAHRLRQRLQATCHGADAAFGGCVADMLAGGKINAAQSRALLRWFAADDDSAVIPGGLSGPAEQALASLVTSQEAAATCT